MSYAALPSFKTLEAILRRVTETLAMELVSPQPHAPDWSEIEWRIATAVVAMQGTTALLVDCLPWRGPDLWETFLVEQRRQMLLRHVRIKSLLERLDIEAKRANISMIALKGAELYRLGVYRAGERSMGDIDLLVRPADERTATSVIAALDYVPTLTFERHAAFEPKDANNLVGYGEHIDNPIKIELHTRIFERLPIAMAEITEDLFPAQRAAGLNPYRALSALMRHLLLHAAGNARAHALRHNQLHDIALLAARMRREDWHELIDACREAGFWWALCPLMLVNRYYSNAIPPFVMSHARRGCPTRLQRACARYALTDVSWSNLRISALPGAEWCKDFGELARFLRMRLLPNRAELAPVEYTAATQAWSKQVPWYGESHPKRIIRWIVSRPPRVQTMYAIREALAID